MDDGVSDKEMKIDFHYCPLVAALDEADRR